MKKKSQSFSLIEVVILVGILSIFFVTAIMIVVYSLHTMKINQYKIIATQYAKQLLTWIRAQKESDWSSFVSHYTNSNPTTFCFNQLPISKPSLPPSDCDPNDYSLGIAPANIFKRYATFIQNQSSNPSKIEVNIYVEWKDAGNKYVIPLSTILSRWE